MKLLSISSLYWPETGGIEVMLDQLLPALRERHGFQVAALTAAGPRVGAGPDVVHGVAVERISFAALRPNDPRGWLSLVAAIKARISTFDPDVVMVHTVAPFSWMAAHALRGSSVPVIYVEHGARAADIRQERAVIGVAGHVVAVSHHALAMARRSVDIADEQTSVIPNGLLAPEGPTVEPPDVPALLCVGRVAPEKGFDLAIAAMPALLSRWPDITLTIVGEGSAMDALVRQAGALGLGHAVRFTGRLDRDQVATAIDAASIVVVPSRNVGGFTEAFCIVALEAAQRRRPVVASDIDGLPETVLGGRTGLLIPPNDVDAIVGAVTRLLDDPAEAGRLATSAHERALRQFTTDAMTDAYAEICHRYFPRVGVV